MERKKINTLFVILVVIIGCLFISTCKNPLIQRLTDHMYCSVCERANARCVCSSGSPAPLTYNLGDQGPGGGWIFYINPNSATEGWTYLEAAPTNVPDNSTMRNWATGTGINISGLGNGIGTGRSNTTLILGGDPGAPAALAADTYNINGVSDWFLPSIDELDRMMSVLYVGGPIEGISLAANTGGFPIGRYWSSTQSTAWNAWAIVLNNVPATSRAEDGKTLGNRVRAARRF